MWRSYRSIPIVYRLGAAFVLGSIVGLAVGQPATALEPLGDLFVDLLSMIVIPIVVFTLVMGMRRLSPGRLGRVGGQVVLVYLVTSGIAVLFGLLVANLLQPGARLSLSGVEQPDVEEPPALADVVLGIVPDNPIAAMAAGEVLPTIFFTIAFGLALALVQESARNENVRNGVQTIFDIVEAGAEAMFKIVWGVMEYGVVGVFALMAVAFGEAGLGAVRTFGLLVATLLVAVLLHVAVVQLGGIVVLLLGQSPTAFLTGIREALVTALGTASSAGTLPVSMANADDNLHVDEGIYGFSLPLGATINMDGTALYQGVAAVFAANLAGVSLSFGEQLVVVLVAVFASIGTAGVPSAGLIMLTLVLEQLGLPLTIVAFVAGVDPLLDRLRTLTNVSGDLAVTTLVANWNDAVDFDRGSWVGEAPTTSGAPAED